jgi:hypothetical protein
MINPQRAVRFGLARTMCAFALAAVAGGCASMPKVDVGHYLPAAAASYTVTQSATCTAGNVPVMTAEVTPTVAYAGDPGKRRSLKIGSLGSAFGKQDAGFEFYADGRLKSVNAKGTGQAGDALKALIKLAPIFGMVSTAPAQIKAACEKVREIAGDGKALTIVSRGHTDFSSAAGGAIAFTQTSVDSGAYAVLQPIFGSVHGMYTISKPTGPAHLATTGKNEEALILIEPARAAVDVQIVHGDRRSAWPSTVLVPQHGVEYAIPIQKAPWFGSNEMEVQVHESGKVTKLRYAGAGDAAGAFGVLGDAWTTANQKPASPTTSDQAKAVQAEADLIYQQQRLVICHADATQCPK